MALECDSDARRYGPVGPSFFFVLFGAEAPWVTMAVTSCYLKVTPFPASNLYPLTHHKILTQID